MRRKRTPLGRHDLTRQSFDFSLEHPSLEDTVLLSPKLILPRLPRSSCASPWRVASGSRWRCSLRSQGSTRIALGCPPPPTGTMAGRTRVMTGPTRIMAGRTRAMATQKGRTPLTTTTMTLAHIGSPDRRRTHLLTIGIVSALNPRPACSRSTAL